MKFFKFIIVYLLVIGVGACSDPVVSPTSSKTYKLLFVGNSFTFYNSGVDYHLQQMLEADKSSDPTTYTIQKIAVSSYTLQDHYNDSLTIRKIRSDKWDKVVLQEQSTRPMTNRDLFLQYATLLDAKIKKESASTVLYMTWPEKATPTDINSLSSAYLYVGQQIKAPVVPVGLVWEYVVNNYPQLNLYYTDDKHPALTGTFLIACTFYFSLFNKNPVINSYLPAGLNINDAIVIRKAVNDFMTLYK
jgi:hypothetical protein